MESVGKIVSFMLLAFLTIAGTMLILLRFDTVSESYATDLTNKFANECQTTGKIDPDNYRIFYKNIYGMGNYEINIAHRSIKSYPSGGSFFNDYIEYSNQTIMESMFPTTSVYNPSTGQMEFQENQYLMKKGDVIIVTISRHASSGEKLLRFMTGNGFSDVLVTRYSGTIGYTGFTD